ncbi:MAG: extracellular solute-binding protein [bacterium]
MTSRQILGIGIFTAVVLIYVLVFYLFTHRQEPTVTEIYFADRMTEAHHLLINRYNALHAGSIKVVPIDFPNSEFNTDTRKELLARSLRGEDDAIDVLAVDVIWVHRFAKWCEPLGKYFTDAERKRVRAKAMETCYHEGELVAVPLDIVLGVMYYREDLLKQFPRSDQTFQQIRKGMTWAQFLQLQARLNWKGPFYIFPAADYEGLICSYIELVLSLRPDYFETVGFRFDTPETKKALQLLVDLVHTYSATPRAVSNFTEVPSYAYFIRHDGLFIRGWTSYEKDFKYEAIDREKEQHLRMAPIPYPAGGKPKSVFGGWNIMVSKASTKKEAAIDFVKFLLEDQSQEIFYTLGGYYPVINSFYSDTTFLRRYPEIAAINELMTFGAHRPLGENYTKYSKIMARYFSLAIMGKISVDDALRRVHTAIVSEDSESGGR